MIGYSSLLGISIVGCLFLSGILIVCGLLIGMVVCICMAGFPPAPAWSLECGVGISGKVGAGVEPVEGVAWRWQRGDHAIRSNTPAGPAAYIPLPYWSSLVSPCTPV